MRNSEQLGHNFDCVLKHAHTDDRNGEVKDDWGEVAANTEEEEQTNEHLSRGANEGTD